MSHGRIVSQRTTEGLRLTETVHPPGLHLPRHKHEHPAITLVLEGGFIETFGRHGHDCGPLSLLFKPAGCAHTNRYSSQGARSFIVEVDTAAAGRSDRFASLDQLAPQVGTAGLVLLALQVYRTCHGLEDHGVGVEELVLALLGLGERRLSRPALRLPHQNPWLRDVAAMIREQVPVRPSLAVLAEHAGVHPVYLARAFRRALGVTVGEYVRRCRIDRAVRALAADDPSTARVASETGYCDQSHFSRAFARETGCPPGRFRREALRTLRGGASTA